MRTKTGMNTAAWIVALALGLSGTAKADFAKTNPVTGETENYTWKFTGTDTWNNTNYWENSDGEHPANVPGKTGEGADWLPMLFDGDTININAGMSVEGWDLRLGLYNGASLTVYNLQKWQGDTDMWVTVDETSQFTVGVFQGGNLGGSTGGQTIKYSTVKASGIKWNVNLATDNWKNNTFEYYLSGEGSVSYQGISACSHKIKQADVTLSEDTAKSIKSKTLVSFTSSSQTFTADATITVKNSSGTEIATKTLTNVYTTDGTTLDTTYPVGTCELVQTLTGIVLYYVDGPTETTSTELVATAVWETGGFGLTKNGYSITLNGNSINSDGNIAISSSAGGNLGASIAIPGTQVGKATVLIKYSNLAPIATINRGLASMLCVWGSSQYDVGARTFANNSLPQTGFTSGSSNYYDFAGESNRPTPPEGSGYVVLTCDTTSSAGTSFYAGSSLDTLSGGKNTSLKYTSYSIQKIALGGANTTSKAYSWNGVVIEKVAIFLGNAYTGADLADYEWPSERYAKWNYADGKVLTWNTASDAAGNNNDFIAYNDATYDVFNVSQGCDSGTTATNGNDANSLAYWRRFCFGQAGYAAPGQVLRLVSGYYPQVHGKFAPMTLGGLIVERGATGYSISSTADKNNRSAALGDPTGQTETWFEINEDFTIGRTGGVAIMGTVNLDIAEGKTFTLSSAASMMEVAAVNTALAPQLPYATTAGGTLKLSGTGTLKVSTLTATNGTIDVSSLGTSGRRYIDGTLIVDANTQFVFPDDATFPFAVATAITGSLGTRSVTDADGDVWTYTLSIDGSSRLVRELTQITINSNGAKTFSGNTNAVITVAAGATLNVSGNATLKFSDRSIKGTLNILEGATLTLGDGSSDALNYSGTGTINVYGTLAMGGIRWTVGSGNTINLYTGATISGSQEKALHFNIGAGRINVKKIADEESGTATISAPVILENGDGGTVAVDGGMTLVLLVNAFGDQTTKFFTKTGEGTLKFQRTGTGTTRLVYEEGAIEIADDWTYEIDIGGVRDASGITKAGGCSPTVALTASQTSLEYATGTDTTITGLMDGLTITVKMRDGSADVTAQIENGTARVPNDGVLKISGAATAIDATFTNTIDLAYSMWSGASMGHDGMWVSPQQEVKYNNDLNDKTTGVYLKYHPYVSGINNKLKTIQDRMTLAVVGTMSPTENTMFIHMGFTSENSTYKAQGILLTRTANENEVLVAYNTGKTVNPITTMTVPNCATTRHVYIITKEDGASSTTFTVYLDGLKWKTVTTENVVSLIDQNASIQVGSDVGGFIKGDEDATYKAVDINASVEDEPGVINLMRLYDRVITPEEIAKYTEEYPYVSPNGSFTRTITAETANFSEDGAWSKAGDTGTYATPASEAAAAITVGGATKHTDIMVNTTLALESLTINGNVTFKAADTKLVSNQGLTTINGTVTNEYGAVEMAGGPTMLTDGSTLHFDYSAYIDDDSGKAVPLTGDIDAESAERVTVAVPTTVNFYTFERAYTNNQVALVPTHVSVAETGGMEYTSLSNAVAAASAGDTITLLRAPRATESVVVDKDVTFAVANNNIYMTLASLQINAGRTLTFASFNKVMTIGAITGGGNIASTGSNTLNINISGDTYIVGSINTSAGLQFQGYGTISCSSDVNVNGKFTCEPTNAKELHDANSTAYDRGYTIKLTAYSVTADELNGGATIETANGVMASGGTFYGTIGGTGGLTANGNFTFQGPAGYSGELVVADGKTLSITNRLSSMTNLRFELDASDPSTYVLDGTSLVSFKGRGGYRYSTNNVASAATYVPEGSAYFGGKPYFLFGNNSSYYGGSKVQVFSYIAVTRPSSSNTGYLSYYSSYYSSGQDKLGHDSTKWFLQTYGRNNDDLLFQNGTTNKALSVDNDTMISALYEITASNNRQDTLGYNYTGAIAEYAGFTSRISLEDRIACEMWLSRKWNLDCATNWRPMVSANANVITGDGSTLDLGGYANLTVASFTGGGPIVGGTLYTVGNVYTNTGALAMNAVNGMTVLQTANATGLTINGDADTVNVTITDELLTSGHSFTITTNGTIHTLNIAIPSASIFRVDSTLAVNDDGTITIGPTDPSSYTPATYVWTGAKDTNWSNPANWTVYGYDAVGILPQAIDTVVFPASGAPWTAELSSQQTITNLTVNGETALSGALIQTGEVFGEGKIVLGDDAGFCTYNPSTSRLVISNNLEIAASASSTNYVKSFNSNNSSGSSVFIYGNITGSGTLCTTGPRLNCELFGDNSEFEGTIYIQKDGQDRNMTYLQSEKAASMKAKWRGAAGGGGMFTRVAGGTFKFGSLSGSVNYPNQSDYRRQTIEVGHLGLDDTLGGTWFNTTYLNLVVSSEAEDTVTDGNNRGHVLRKVGSGTLTFSGKYLRKYEVNDGTLVLASDDCFVWTKDATTYRSRFSFGGGILKLAEGVTGDPSSRITQSTYPIKIDDGGMNRVWETVLASSNTDGFQKYGSGTLTLTEVPEYTGTTWVKGGALLVPVAFTNAENFALGSSTYIESADETYATLVGHVVATATVNGVAMEFYSIEDAAKAANGETVYVIDTLARDETFTVPEGTTFKLKIDETGTSFLGGSNPDFYAILDADTTNSVAEATQEGGIVYYCPYRFAPEQWSDSEYTLDDGDIWYVQSGKCLEPNDDATLIITNGTSLEVRNNVQIANAASASNARISVNGVGSLLSVIKANEFRIATGANSEGALIVSEGGTVSTVDGAMKVGYGNSATGAVHIANGGVLNIGGPIVIADGPGATGMLTIEDAELSGIPVTMGVGANSTADIYVFSGGTFAPKTIENGNGSGASATVYMNGGVLKPHDTNSTLIDLGITVCAGDDGAIIDTDGKDVTIAADFAAMDGATTPKLIKRGEGTLTITGNVANGITLYIEHGAGNVIAQTGIACGMNAEETGTTGIYSHWHLGYLDADESNIYDTIDDIRNVEGYTGKTITLIHDADIVLGENETLRINANGYTLAISASGGQSYEAYERDGYIEYAAHDSYAETVWLGPANGNWNDSSNWSAGVPTMSLIARFTSNASAILSGDAETARLVIGANIVTLTSTSGAQVGVYGNIEGSGTLAFNGVGLANKRSSRITVESGIEAIGDLYVAGESAIIFSGALSGNGTITSTANGMTLSGDNTAFAGTFVYAGAGAVTFGSELSGSTNAAWNITGDIYATGFPYIGFGSLFLASREGETNALYCTSSDSGAPFVIAIEGDGDSSITAPYDFSMGSGSWSGSNADILSAASDGEKNKTLSIDASVADLKIKNLYLGGGEVVATNSSGTAFEPSEVVSLQEGKMVREVHDGYVVTYSLDTPKVNMDGIDYAYITDAINAAISGSPSTDVIVMKPTTNNNESVIVPAGVRLVLDDEGRLFTGSLAFEEGAQFSYLFEPENVTEDRTITNDYYAVEGPVSIYGGRTLTIGMENVPGSLDVNPASDAFSIGTANSTTGTLHIVNGSACGGKTRISPESQSAGMLYVEGGSLTTSSGFLVCEGAMSTGIVHVASGGAITNFDGWTSIGLNNGGYDALLQIDGGEMVTYGSGTSLGAQMGNGSRARIVVNDGMYKTDADVYLGEGSTLNAGNPSGSAEIEMNGGLFDNSAGKTHIGKHENLNSEGYVAALTLKGGEYITGGIECGTGVFSGRIDFNGGTLRAAGPGMFIESNGYLTVTTGTGNGTINDGGYDIEVATDISGAGKLYKAGSGTVTFSGSVTADGGVVVREGTVAVGAGGGITHGITLADSGYLLFDTATNGDTITPPVDITLGGGQVIIVATNKTYAVGNEIILENVTVADGYTLANSIQVRTGLMLDWTPSLSGTTVTLTAYQGSSVNYWVGGTSNMWHNALSWRYGIPTTNQTVAVTNDAIIIYDQTRNTDSNRSKDLCAGTFRIDANVTIKYSGSYINQLFVTDAYEGQGKITLIGSGIRAVNEITIPSTIGIATMNDGTTEIESWIDGEKPVTVEGPFELESSFRNYGHLIIAGKIAGTGTLCSQGTLRVTNNMQNFTGIVEITYEPTYFYGNCTGASNALWKVSNNFYLCDTNQMSAPYEFHFGAIQADTLKRFYMTAATENLYVGEKDDVESYIKGGAHFGTRAWDASDLLTGVTIVKRGGSKFTYSGYGCPNIEVESGELALENFTGTRYDNTTYAFIDSLTVKAGAILSGTYGDNLKNVTFEEGATYRQYLKSGTDGFAYDTLRASDKVTFKDGSVVELKDSTGYLTSVSVANAQTFTLLSAGSFGEGAPDGTGIKTAEGGPCCWMPAKSNNKLIYRAVNTMPGFIIRVR